MKEGCGLCKKYGKACQYHSDQDTSNGDGGPAKRKWCGVKKRGGGTCMLSPGWGTDHLGYGCCKFHGGSTPNAMKAAQKQIAAEEAHRLGLPVDVGPRDALLMAVRGTAGRVVYWQGRVAELEDEQLTWGKTKEEVRTGDGPGTTTVHEAKINLAYESLRVAQRDMVAAAAAAARAGVEERAVRIAESQAQMIAKAMHGVLVELGVADHPQAPRVVRKHLMLASGEQAA